MKLRSLKRVMSSLAVGLLLGLMVCTNSVPAYELEFRGVKLGTKIESLKGFTLEKKEGNLEIYYRKSDKLAIDKVELDTILYLCYKGILFCIQIKSKEFNNYIQLSLILNEKYGKYSHKSTSDKFWTKYWEQDEQEIQLEHNGTSDEVTLTYIDNKIDSMVISEFRKASEKKLKKQ